MVVAVSKASKTRWRQRHRRWAKQARKNWQRGELVFDMYGNIVTSPPWDTFGSFSNAVLLSIFSRRGWSL